MNKFFAIALLFLSGVFTSVIAADMPKVGESAPAFTLPSQDGKEVSLADYKGSWVVLYFYPKDFTSGCSIEAHNFEVDSELYKAKHAVILGVSVDSVESHKAFCTKQGLNFKLLADEQHAVSSLYDSYNGILGMGISARNSFLIDPVGIVRKVYESVDPSKHSKEVLADLAVLQSAQ